MAEITDQHTRNRHAVWHQQLKTQAVVMLDKATQHGHVLDGISFSWSFLEPKLTAEIKWLTETAEELQSFGLPLDPTNLTDIMVKLQTLEDDVENHRSLIESITRETAEILNVVACPQLKETVRRLQSSWQKVTRDLTILSKNLRSLEGAWKV